MIAVSHLFAALVLVAVFELGATAHVLPPWTALLWPLAAYPLAARARRSPRARVARRLLGVWPLVAHGLALGLSGWLGVGAHSAAGLDGVSVLTWPGPGLFAVLAPFVLAEFATTDAIVTGGLRGVAVPRPVRVAACVHTARALAALLVPLALYVVVTTPLRANAQWRAWIDGSVATELAWLVAVGLVFAYALPRVFAFALGLEPLEPDRPERASLLAAHDEVARHLGFRGRAPLLWSTGGREVNAAVVGFVARHRYVVVTDGIARVLDARGARALFAHEMGHAVRRHPALFVQFSIAVLVPGLVLSGALAGSAPYWFVEVGAPLASGVAWLVGFGWLSRRAELEADLVAVRASGDAEPLVQLLARTASPRRWRRDGWRHFAPARRVLFARSAARHLEVGLRLERSLSRARTWSRLGAAIVLLAALAWALGAERADPRGAGDERGARDSVERRVDQQAIGSNDRRGTA